MKTHPELGFESTDITLTCQVRMSLITIFITSNLRGLREPSNYKINRFKSNLIRYQIKLVSQIFLLNLSVMS